MLKRNDLINQVCRKCRISRRDPNSGALSKRELLLINSFLDIVIDRVETKSKEVATSTREGESRQRK